MVSLQESDTWSPGRFQTTRPYYTPPPSSAASSPSHFQKHLGRSMRTIRSNFSTNTSSFTSVEHHAPPHSAVSENLTDSVIDVHLHHLATNNHKSSKSSSSDDFYGLSQVFSDYSAYSSDISGELERLAHSPEKKETDQNLYPHPQLELEPEPEPCLGFLKRDSFSTEIIEQISPEDLQPTVKLCVDSLSSSSIAVKRSAAAKLRLLAKNRSDNRALIGECGAIPALISLLRCTDAYTQEHAVTAIFNLSLLDKNKPLIAGVGATNVKALIYVLKTGTEVSKQNAACALLNLAMIDEKRILIGACGAIPPLVSLLISGSNRGKKDALASLYKLCSVKGNKKRAVTAGVVRPLVEMVVAGGEAGMAEKAMVVMSSVAGVEEGRDAIVEEGGVGALVEVIESGGSGSGKGKEFAVVTVMRLCEGVNGGTNRGLLVAEGVIPPLVALSQTGSVKAKYMAEKLLGYLREARQEGCSSSPK